MTAHRVPWIGSSAVLTLGLGASAALGLAFHLLAARWLEPAGYGSFTAALTYVTLWAAVMECGTSAVLTREAAADPARLGWARPIARWKLALGVAGALGATGSAWLVGLDAPVPALVGVLSIGMMGYVALRLAVAVLRVEGAFRWEAALNTLQKLALVLGLLGLHALGGARPATAALAFTASYGAAALLGVGRARGPVRRAAPTAPPDARLFWRSCAPLGLVELLTNLYFRLDQVLLLELRGPAETGLYGAAFRVVEALLLPVSGVMIALLPRLAVSARATDLAHGADLVPAWRLLWPAAVGLSVHGWLWGADLLPVLLGPTYAAATAPLRALCLALPLLYLNALLTQSLVARGREAFYAAGTGLCVAVNVGANLWLIPAWGAVGAAWATGLTELALLAVCLAGLGPLRPLLPVRATLCTGAGAAAAAALGAWLPAAQRGPRVGLALVTSLLVWECMAPWPIVAGRLPGFRQ